MRVATTFSGGFGSVEFALKYLNIPHEVVFACEWMKPQMESYLLNHGEPTSNFYEDIRDLDGTKYKDEVFYLHESPPCQSYSLAGSRGGAADERGGLMYEAIKKIDEIQPKMFSVENVKGLLSSNGGEDWKNIMRDFKSLKGYTISWGVMNAKEQGTPQNRERVFIVGFRGQAPQFSFPKRVELKKVLRDVLEDEVDEKYFLSDEQVLSFSNSNFNQEQNRLQTKKHCDALLQRDYKSPKLVKVKSATKQGYEEATENDSINLSFPDSKTRIGRVGKNVAQTLDCACNQGVIEPKILQLGRGYNKGGLKNLCPTLTKNSWERNNFLIDYNSLANQKVATNIKESVRKNFIRDYDKIIDSDKAVFYSDCDSGFQDNKVCLTESACLRANNKDTFTLDKEFRIRRLTPRECARVQGDFKDMFKFGKSSDTKLYEFIGNAMDISTTKNLILKMLEHCKVIDFTEPNEPSFEISTKEKPMDTLF